MILLVQHDEIHFDDEHDDEGILVSDSEVLKIYLVECDDQVLVDEILLLIWKIYFDEVDFDDKEEQKLSKQKNKNQLVLILKKHMKFQFLI